jgi:hypothetical protein
MDQRKAEMAHTLSCRCEKTQWQVDEKARGSQVVCYCRDCQAHLTHLGRADLLHDGGTYLYQTTPDAVKITKGAENLAAQKLGPQGMIRYYTTCCHSPVVNTLKNRALPFVGLPLPDQDKRFGRVICYAHTDQGTSGRKQKGFAAAGMGIMVRALSAILSGRRASPFFTDSGDPVVAPRVLTLEERRAATPNR